MARTFGGRTPLTSLSARTTLVSAAALGAAIVLITLSCVDGVYRFAMDRRADRLRLTSELIARNTASRIAEARLSAASAGARLQMLATRDPLADPGTLGSAVRMRPDESLIEMADGTMVPVAGRQRTLPPAVTRAATVSRADTCTVVAGDRTVWLIHPFVAGERRYCVVSCLNMDDLLVVAHGASDSDVPSALFIDRRGGIIGGASPDVSCDAIECGVAASGSRTVRASGPDGRILAGTWTDAGLSPFLDWRVVTLSPRNEDMRDVGRVLAPAGLTMVGASLLGLLFVLLYSRNLAQPIRAFEIRARELVSGSRVRPVAVERSDELGRLAEAFNEMGARLNALQDVSSLLASASDPDDVLDAVLDSLGHILQTGDVAVLLADQTGERLRLARGHGLATPTGRWVVSAQSDSPPAVAFRLQERRLFDSADEDAAGVYEVFGADPSRAGVAEPLMTGSTVLGAIVVLSPGRRPFTDAQLDTLRVFSANAAVAVRISRLFAAEQRSRTEAETMRVIAELLVRRTDLARSLERAGSAAAELLGYGGWTVALEERQRLGMYPDADPAADIRLMAAWEHVSAMTAPDEDHEPVLVDLSVPGPLEELFPQDWRSAMLIPLHRGGAVRGLLVLFDRDEVVAPSRRGLTVAGTIGKEVSLAIQNSYLLQQARLRAANLETVFHISQAVSSELQVHVVLNRVLDVVQKILAADAVTLMSYDRERQLIETSMTRGISQRDMLYMRIKPGIDIPGRVFETRTPLLYGKLSRGVGEMAQIAAAEGFESLIAVPLMARGRPIGVLMVYSREVDAFAGEDMELLLTFASQAALAIDTAFLFGREHHVASVLQSSILPDRIPDIPDLDTAGFYVPSGADAHIGGDYYDVFTAPDGRIVFAIGDVCGKGVVAATKTSVVKYTLRGLIGAGATPAEALAELNRQVTATGDQSDIVTIWVGMLERASRRLTYANGGHPPGLLSRAGTRAIERLEATGPLLGVVAGIDYGDRSVVLGDGDLLLLHTDGVTEARRGRRFFGEGRVRRVLKHATTPRECIDGLLSAVRTFSEGPLSDDAAAVAVRCRVRPLDGDGGLPVRVG